MVVNDMPTAHSALPACYLADCCCCRARPSTTHAPVQDGGWRLPGQLRAGTFCSCLHHASTTTSVYAWPAFRGLCHLRGLDITPVSLDFYACHLHHELPNLLLPHYAPTASLGRTLHAGHGSLLQHSWRSALAKVRPFHASPSLTSSKQHLLGA